MLTERDYTSLWSDPALGFSQTHAMPSWDEYVIRENQLQDYLDIFRGENTRGRRPIKPPVWYYPHPFLGELNGKDFAPKIEYIMIGEAAPPLKPSIPGVLLDVGNSYFYNINHINSTQYFNAPCSAFGIAGITKVDKLIALAKQGVLLLDIFPFASNYSPKGEKKGRTFRDGLNNRGGTRYFWNNVGEEITSLRQEGLLQSEYKLALLAPPIISHFIAEGINSHVWPTFGCTVRLGVNVFTPDIPVPVGVTHFSGIPEGTILLTPVGHLRLTITKAPIYACCCYDGSNYPQSIYIKSAFA
jgi:hypothetical protein